MDAQGGGTGGGGGGTKLEDRDSTESTRFAERVLTRLGDGPDSPVAAGSTAPVAAAAAVANAASSTLVGKDRPSCFPTTVVGNSP